MYTNDEQEREGQAGFTEWDARTSVMKPLTHGRHMYQLESAESMFSAVGYGEYMK